MHGHYVSASCKGERCRCGREATHKVGEEIPWDEPSKSPFARDEYRGQGRTIPDRHNFTAYVCCRCFRALMGPAVFCAPSDECEGVQAKFLGPGGAGWSPR